MQNAEFVNAVAARGKSNRDRIARLRERDVIGQIVGVGGAEVLRKGVVREIRKLGGGQVVQICARSRLPASRESQEEKRREKQQESFHNQNLRKKRVHCMVSVPVLLIFMRLRLAAERPEAPRMPKRSGGCRRL